MGFRSFGTEVLFVENNQFLLDLFACYSQDLALFPLFCVGFTCHLCWGQGTLGSVISREGERGAGSWLTMGKDFLMVLGLMESLYSRMGSAVGKVLAVLGKKKGLS